MNNFDNFIKVGQIIAAHGLKGQFILRSFTSPLSKIFCYNNLYNSVHEICKIKKIGLKNSKGRETYICSSENFTSRNDIEIIIKSFIFTTRTDFTELDNNEYYQIDLINCDVILNESNEIIAKIIDVQNFGAGDIVEIKFVKNLGNDECCDEKTIMIPFNEKYINNVDLLNKKVYITLPTYA